MIFSFPFTRHTSSYWVGSSFVRLSRGHAIIICPTGACRGRRPGIGCLATGFAAFFHRSSVRGDFRGATEASVRASIISFLISVKMHFVFSLFSMFRHSTLALVDASYSMSLRTVLTRVCGCMFVCVAPFEIVSPCVCCYCRRQLLNHNLLFSSLSYTFVLFETLPFCRSSVILFLNCCCVLVEPK